MSCSSARNQVCKPVVALFDVCGTLYSQNTTIGLIDAAAREYDRDDLAKTVQRWTSKRHLQFIFGALIYRLFGRDIAKEHLVFALRGLTKEQLLRAGRNYVARTLPSYEVNVVFNLLHEHLARAHQVVLISNSLDVVVKPIADMLGVEYLSSELLFKDDVCAGRLKLDLTGQKANALRRKMDVTEHYFVFYTDNRTDIDLVELANEVYIVAQGESDRKYWSGHEVDFLEVR